MTANLFTMKNLSKLKENRIMEKSTQVFTTIKYQKKTLRSKFIIDEIEKSSDDSDKERLT